MLTERVRVLSVSDDEIELEALPAGSCQGCSLAAACGRKLLQALHPQRRLRLQGEQARRCMAGAGKALKSGNIAHIELAESGLLYLSFLFYLLPLGAVMLVCLFAGLAALGEGSTMLLAALAFAVSVLIQKQCLRANRNPGDNMLLTAQQPNSRIESQEKWGVES